MSWEELKAFCNRVEARLVFSGSVTRREGESLASHIGRIDELVERVVSGYPRRLGESPETWKARVLRAMEGEA